MRTKFNAARFRMVRIERGYTLEELAKSISEKVNDGKLAEDWVHIAAATLSRWENGECKPTKRFVPAILKVLRLKSQDLFTVGR